MDIAILPRQMPTRTKLAAAHKQARSSLRQLQANAAMKDEPYPEWVVDADWRKSKAEAQPKIAALLAEISRHEALAETKVKPAKVKPAKAKAPRGPQGQHIRKKFEHNR